MASRASYRTFYFPDARDFERIRAKAKEAGVSASEYVRRSALGELGPAGAASPERARALEEEARYWRERFEQMATLAQDMQAEILQLRQEIRLRDVSAGLRAAGGLDAASAGLGPRVLKALASLRSADGGYRVWTEADLREELALREVAQADALRAALADLYRLSLVEPQRNGWRART